MIRRRTQTLVLLCASMALAACGTGGREHPTATWHAPRARGMGGGGPVASAARRDADAGGTAAGQRVRKRPPPPPPAAPSPAPPSSPGGGPDAPSTPSPDPSASAAAGQPPAGALRRTGTDAVALTFDDGPSQYAP
jgi:peptidoglycan-N-acetylglucosamine deacetylase